MDYQNICKKLIQPLPSKYQDVIANRFGLGGGTKTTLQALGNKYNITRERVRQIQNRALSLIKQTNKKIIEEAAKEIEYVLKKEGGIKREDILLEKVDKENANEVFFLLHLADPFYRGGGNEKIHFVWSIGKEKVDEAEQFITDIIEQLEDIGEPVSLVDLDIPKNLDRKWINSVIEASKTIQFTRDDLVGLYFWPEVNPKYIRDKAYYVLKREGKPLHFVDIAKKINEIFFQNDKRAQTNVKTVHNELIKDERFVLIGRGLYALSEWGYQPGFTKEIIARVLKEAGKPLSFEEIKNKVLLQRKIKENTIISVLSNNRNIFLRTEDGKYYLKDE
ncbi:RNA polymerase sigma factor RpoS [bacterium HR34]|nr:RNA polymerase sigma factor RpoS [bacterium HR34]